MPNNYQASTAAIRCAYGQRLRSTDYRDLLNLHSIPEVVQYLKETERYGELLSSLEPMYTHRGHLEMLLERGIFDRCVHFCGMEQLLRKPFFRFFVYEYEIRELCKAAMLGNQQYISAMNTWLTPYASFRVDALARAQNEEEMVAAVSHTPFAPILKKYLLSARTGTSLAECEIAMRAAAFSKLLKDAEKTLSGSDLEAFRGLVGEQIDLINIINAYRLISVFHTDQETLSAMLLPDGGKLPKRICKELYSAKTADGFLSVLSTTRYGRKLGGFAAIGDIPDHVRLEHAFQTLRYQTARRALHFSGHAAVSLYAEHFLDQIEVRNLITIIEGIRYQKPVSYMQSLLITE